MRSVRSHIVLALSLMGLTLLGVSAVAQNGEEKPVSMEEALRLALDSSPELKAALRRLDAATWQLRGAKSPYNPQVELAPGVGFTNSTNLLSQRLDISGRRNAEGRRAGGERSAVAASLDTVRLQVVAETRLAYYDLVRAQKNFTTAEEAVLTAQQIRNVVKKRVEIGEAPPVQQARAEIEVTRIAQEAVRARGDLKARQATLNLLLGRKADSSLTPADAMTPPTAPAPTFTLTQQALNHRPELTVAAALIEARRGEVDTARAAGRPDLFADVAADVWSLDRDSSLRNQGRTSGTMGFQLRVGFPLFDRGGLRADVDRARANVRAQESDLDALRRRMTIEVERAAAELSALREVVLNYEQSLLPQSADLFTAVRSGFESGISSFLEVLEAQRVTRQTQVEYQDALFEAIRAQIALDRAIGILPVSVRTLPTMLPQNR